ncbi:1-deoxy-D-xylulose-5-phosphate reductoisomerase [Anaerotardibacter muris]|uniref:1-deoxy-D-xylulose-5-phosphate reductoisomerase n=1 Tax=Anaerotardibacter muris TaxID=2941505 RepID=UPI00203B9BCF|nr:1-deoxy-D-xylulose-5-phosphate reductoisomerase [Anaerotardibacter muris]
MTNIQQAHTANHSEDSAVNPKRIAVLGSTGSIGTQTLDVARRHPQHVKIVALSANTQVEMLFDQAREFSVKHAVLADEALCNTWKARFAEIGATLHGGSQAIVELCQLPEVDMVVNALVGAAGMRASYATLTAGKQLALANKESLVVGGDVLMPLSSHTTLLPIDSEHGAIYQCLLGEDPAEVARLWVTASGGPFRGKKLADLQDITPAQALSHPTWNMGRKISIDSSTLMNKGLEVIEAHHLFNMPYDKIEVVVQPQSAIHSMVEFTDGSVKAHLGTTDMRIPIQFAISYPARWSAPVEPLDFRTLGSLEFSAPDLETFRCLALAIQAGNTGGTLPAVMNAANEVAVAAFLDERIPYLSIAQLVESAMDHAEVEPAQSIDQLLEVDAETRAYVRSLIQPHE